MTRSRRADLWLVANAEDVEQLGPGAERLLYVEVRAAVAASNRRARRRGVVGRWVCVVVERVRAWREKTW